ncbi:hypothetical protein ACOSQ2_003210 [Xanthoceras sorbifolium]
MARSTLLGYPLGLMGKLPDGTMGFFVPCLYSKIARWGLPNGQLHSGGQSLLGDVEYEMYVGGTMTICSGGTGSVFELYTWWDWASKLVLAGGTVVLLRSFLSLTYAALDALVGSNPEEVGSTATPPNGIGRNARSNGIGTVTRSNYGSKPPKGRNAVNPGIGRDAATSQKME